MDRELKAKMLTFRVLSQCFAYPENALLKELQSISVKGNNELTFTESIITAFQQEKTEKLQSEYTRLFISGYPRTCCPPYESFYREGRLLGEANLEVQEMYKEWGMAVDPALADHIATELEFLAFLWSARKLPSIEQKAIRAANQFLTDHLFVWGPLFACDLRNNTTLQFYRLIANQLLIKTKNEIC